MRSSTAARRYAAAMFALASEIGKVSEVQAELAGLAKLFEQNEELRSAMLTPLHPAEQRKAVLSALARNLEMSDHVRNFYSFLIDRRRLVDFDLILAHYERLANEALGVLTAQVVSAGKLDRARKDRLRHALSQRVGQDVQLELRVDPDLIGGIVAQVGDLILDGSLRTQLGQLRANLMREA
jgi:F-type H+-transporting ATPase subunit delta